MTLHTQSTVSGDVFTIGCPEAGLGLNTLVDVEGLPDVFRALPILWLCIDLG